MLLKPIDVGIFKCCMAFAAHELSGAAGPQGICGSVSFWTVSLSDMTLEIGFCAVVFWALNTCIANIVVGINVSFLPL